MSLLTYAHSKGLPHWRRPRIGWIAMPIALLLGVMVLAATLFLPAEARSVPAREWRGLQEGGVADRVLVVRSNEQWQALWQGMGRKAPAPLNINKQVAVFVSLGSRPSAGYSARLVSATEHDDRLFIVWEEIAPGPGRMAAQVVTHPWLMVVVDRGNLSPVIEQRLR